MAFIERDTRVHTIIQIGYSELAGSLLRREVHRIKDKILNDFVTVHDVTTNVGDKEAWTESLEEQKIQVTELRDEQFESQTEQIESLQDQIDEIDEIDVL